MLAGNHLDRTGLLDRARRFIPFDDSEVKLEGYGE